jgi:hypothetical protein
MKKLGLAVLAAAMALSVAGDASLAASKKKKSRSDYTSEQRDKIYADALAACRKKYGTRVSNVSVNYAKGVYICRIYY